MANQTTQLHPEQLFSRERKKVSLGGMCIYNSFTYPCPTVPIEYDNSCEECWRQGSPVHSSNEKVFLEDMGKGMHGAEFEA